MSRPAAGEPGEPEDPLVDRLEGRCDEPLQAEDDGLSAVESQAVKFAKLREDLRHLNQWSSYRRPRPKV